MKLASKDFFLIQLAFLEETSLKYVSTETALFVNVFQ